MILNKLATDRRSKQDQSLISDSDVHAAGTLHCCRLCIQKGRHPRHSGSSGSLGGPPRAMTSMGKVHFKILSGIPAPDVDFDKNQHKACESPATLTTLTMNWLPIISSGGDSEHFI
jgi:hypothetical protein